MNKEFCLIKPNQSDLEAFCEDPVNTRELTKLSITGSVRGVAVSTFSPLSKLDKLEELTIEDALSQVNLEQICELQNLKKLNLYHAGKLNDLEPLRKLLELNSLTVTVPTGWITRCLSLPTFEPLGSLPKLKYLNLAGVTVARDGLAPLKQLTELRELYVVKQYWGEMDAMKGVRSRT